LVVCALKITGHPKSDHRPLYLRAKANIPKPSRYIGGRSRSVKRHLAAIIPILRTGITILPVCFRSSTSMPKRSRAVLRADRDGRSLARLLREGRRDGDECSDKKRYGWWGVEILRLRVEGDPIRQHCRAQDLKACARGKSSSSYSRLISSLLNRSSPTSIQALSDQRVLNFPTT
jgi:hypothetical protein